MGQNVAKEGKGGEGERKKPGEKADFVSPANPPKKTKNSSSIIINNNINNNNIIININKNNNVIIDIDDNNNVVININNNKKNGEVADGEEPGADFSRNDTKKPKKLPVSTTVVLKIPIYCDGCKDRIKETISEIKGVEKVEVDMAEGLVTVKGTMDSKYLLEKLKKKFKRRVELVPPSKDKDKDKDKDERTRRRAAAAAA